MKNARFILFLVAAVFATGCEGSIQDTAANTALQPVPRDAKWMKRHQEFVETARKGGVEVLFLGDSITDHWRDRGRVAWDENFGALRAANFGIISERTQHLLWRIANGELDGLSPKVVVLLIGTNNTGFEPDKVTPRNTPAEAAEGVKAIVRTLRAKLPAAKVLLLGIFPRGEKPDNPQRLQIAEINRILARLDDGRWVRFLDIGPQFLAPDGTLSKAVTVDFLHPNARGYEIWAAAIKEPLAELLK